MERANMLISSQLKIPRRVEFSETELPKSGSGKILKRILRERFWAHQEPPIRRRIKFCAICPRLTSYSSLPRA